MAACWEYRLTQCFLIAGYCLVQPLCPWFQGSHVEYGAAAGHSLSQVEPRPWGTVRDGDAAAAGLALMGLGRPGEQAYSAVSLTQPDCTLCTPRLGPLLLGRTPPLPLPPQAGKRQLICRKRPGFVSCQPLTCPVAGTSQLFPGPCYLNL